MEKLSSLWSWQFEAIGTHWQIDIYKAHQHADELSVLHAVQARIAEFDRNYSRFRSDSLVSQMSKKAGKYTLPADGQKLLDIYERLYGLTGAAVTPMIGDVLEQAGYDAKYSLREKVLTPTLKWDEAIKYNFPSLEVLKPVVLDFGAAGKGYLIDIVARLLEDLGCPDFCVDAGSDMVYKNSSNEYLQVGLENPHNIQEVIGVTRILNQSLCASAGNRRQWGRFHHIIDPNKQTSPTEVIAVWTIAKEALVADALSTCLFFVHPDILISHFDFEYFIMYEDSSIVKSEGFQAEIFSKE